MNDGIEQGSNVVSLSDFAASETGISPIVVTPYSPITVDSVVNTINDLVRCIGELNLKVAALESRSDYFSQERVEENRFGRILHLFQSNLISRTEARTALGIHPPEFPKPVFPGVKPPAVDESAYPKISVTADEISEALSLYQASAIDSSSIELEVTKNMEALAKGAEQRLRDKIANEVFGAEPAPQAEEISEASS